MKRLWFSFCRRVPEWALVAGYQLCAVYVLGAVGYNLACWRFAPRTYIVSFMGHKETNVFPYFITESLVHTNVLVNGVPVSENVLQYVTNKP